MRTTPFYGREVEMAKRLREWVAAGETPESIIGVLHRVSANSNPDWWATDAEIERAGDEYACDELQLDGAHVLAHHVEEGLWVQAWVWLERRVEDEEVE